MMFCVLRDKRTGFTLIEIMIVIAIIAILAAVVVPNIAMARFEAGLTACLKNCETGMKALQMARVRHTSPTELVRLITGIDDIYCDDTTGYGGDLNRLVDLGYLAKSLRCPVDRSGYSIDCCFSEGTYIDYFYRDWQCTQNVLVRAPYCHVYSLGYHYFGDYRAWPVYEESAGPGFWR